MIDIGANLTDPVFNGCYRGKQKHLSDYDQMLQRAAVAGVTKIIVTGGSLSESADALKLAQKKSCHVELFSTVGVHPTRCQEFEQKENPQEYFTKLYDLCQEGMKAQKVVAIGECGLDYDRLEFCPKDIQLKYFLKQFDLAEMTGLPMFLHNRNTGGDFYEMVRQNRHRFKHGVVHSFTGSAEEASELIKLGLYIGINGCSLKTAENIEVMKSIPSDKIMIETDAPWCDIRSTHAGYSHVQTKWDSKKAEKFTAGHCVKGRNEPCTLLQVLEVIAACRGENQAELSKQILENTNSVFFNDM